jgi:serine/threonine protein kinase
VCASGRDRADMKPANIFLMNDGSVKLGDLGLSRFFSSKTHEVFSLVGTPWYMSPEAIMNEGYSFESDIWSMGCFVYEICEMRSPFFLPNANLYLLGKKIRTADYEPMSVGLYSDALRKLVAQMLVIPTADRPTAAQVLEYCQQAFQHFSSVAASGGVGGGSSVGGAHGGVGGSASNGGMSSRIDGSSGADAAARAAQQQAIQLLQQQHEQSSHHLDPASAFVGRGGTLASSSAAAASAAAADDDYADDAFITESEADAVGMQISSQISAHMSASLHAPASAAAAAASNQFHRSI